MKVLLLLTGLFFAGNIHPDPNIFLASQRKFPRVQAACNAKEAILKDRLEKLQLQPENLHVLLVAYKAEKTLEVFAKSKAATTYRKLCEYPVCALSGKPGPKRMQGDGQIPEGFYEIDRFHPESSYHLALGINYPNPADKIRTGAQNPGGDIFIHGDCKTIGCLPMTDNLMQEIYLLAVHARNSGQQKIPVYIFPFRLSEENLAMKEIVFKADEEMSAFWHNLKTGYDLFQTTSEELNFTVSNKGNYQFK